MIQAFRAALFAVMFGALLSLGSVAHAGMDAGILAQNLCREFTGIFRWDGASLPQFIRMQVRDVTVGRNQLVTVRGVGRYVVYLRNEQVSQTNIDFRWEVDAASLGIVMQEMNPDTDTFITDGDYRGRISADLGVIEARWRTRGTQDTGTLQLRAGSDCRSGV